MTHDLKQIATEIAEAVFSDIEHRKTLLKGNIADVLHRELAVRFGEQMEPITLGADNNPRWASLIRKRLNSGSVYDTRGRWVQTNSCADGRDLLEEDIKEFVREMEEVDKRFGRTPR